jgi:hypothetical protein
MMRRSLQKALTSGPLSRRRKGQAMPLAALGLLIMVLSIIATMNLSQAVYQKMRTQNAADAAAYSLAAMEARAFNFIALTNRTQVTHYNTALVLQSYLSYAGFVMAISHTTRDLVKIAGEVTQKIAEMTPYPYRAVLEALARAYKAYAQIMTGVFRFAGFGYKLLHKVVSLAVDAISRFNKYAIWEMQFIRLLLVNSHLITGMYEFIQGNDPEMGLTSKNMWFNVLLASVLNSLEFRSVFDRGAGLNPFWADALFLGMRDYRRYKFNPDEPSVEKAMAVMAEMINASRNNQGIYDRSGGAFSLAIWGSKKGHTKVVDKAEINPVEIKRIRDDPKNYIEGADTLASDDFMSAGMGWFGFPGMGLLVNAGKLGDAIYADDEGGEHYRYRESGTSPGGPGGQGDTLAMPPLISIEDTMETKTGNEANHNFRMAPYFKFRPNSEPFADYGQPSTWIFLNKHHENFQTGDSERPWHYKFDFTHGQMPTASLDTTIGGKNNSYLFEGVNVISRGMVYYHRPGCWSEHPNFFNPFWRARLAPVGGALQNIFNRFVSSRINTSSDNQIIRMIVNFVRNMVADFFLRIVTAVMTH